MVLTATQPIQDNESPTQPTLGDNMKDIEQRLKDIERRVELLEAPVAKLTNKPVTRPVKQLDQFAIRIRSVLLNAENHIFSRDLLRTEDIVWSIRMDLMYGGDLYGGDLYDVDPLMLSVTVPARLKLIPDFKSVVMTGYTDRGTKRFNQSVWIIRNHGRYENMSVTQIYHEYKAQRDRADLEYSSQPHMVIK